MSRKQVLIKGTIILTLTGFATRFMGFFYRIFLSHTFGEEGVGIYQLIFPIYAMGFSLTSAGIELALSRSTAYYIAKNEKHNAAELLLTALLITEALSIIAMLLIQRYAGFLAVSVLHEPRCEKLLMILSYVFPFSALHSSICGYYLGMKKTKIPSVSQLIEQITRIGSVWLLYTISCAQGHPFGIAVAVSGLIAGEICSSLYCLNLLSHEDELTFTPRAFTSAFKKHAGSLTGLSLPLTGSRVMLNILQSIEAVSIPIKLQLYGMSVKASLSTYGVLTGMALPCILFPSAITNSVSTMLLPTVAEIQAMDERSQLSSLIRKVFFSCISLGSICCAGLLLFGQWIGKFLFHSPSAGDFIVTLAWMCPFLYTNNTLLSILNGIGKINLSFFINAISLVIRIAGVLLFIPQIGIYGYLWGLLISQLSIFFFCLFYLHYYLQSSTLRR